MFKEENEHEIRNSGMILGEFLSKIDQELAKRGQIYHPKEKLAWQKLVSEPLASHSTIKALEDGVLIIACQHSAHLQLLHMQKKSILEKLQVYYPSLQIMHIKGILE